MSCSPRPFLLLVLYSLNFAVLGCLLATGFFLSQGFFGDLYTCNESTEAEIEQLYDIPEGTPWVLEADFCLVDLNYTAILDGGEPQEFYALEVALPCDRLVETDNRTTTPLCYNHYQPEFFASVGSEDEVGNYSREQSDRDLRLGLKAALWMALLGAISSGLHRHMDSVERRLLRLQDAALQLFKHARARLGVWKFGRSFRWTFHWRRRRGAQEASAVQPESEMQHMSTREEV